MSTWRIRNSRWLTTLAVVAVVMAGLALVIGSGGGGGNGNGGVAPVLEEMILTTDEAAAGIEFTITGDWSFTDADGDLGNGSFNFEYLGITQTILLPDTLNGITAATVYFELLAQLSDAVGEIVVSCWLIDSAGHKSNTLEVTFHQVWTRQFGTPDIDKGLAITRDPGDNVIVAGTTQGDLDGQTNNGQQDVFVSKYSSTAQKQWTTVYGSTQGDVATGVATDSVGNIYVTGFTNGANFDGETSAGLADAFLTRLDSDGNRVWTVLLGTAADDKSHGIVIDASNLIYITGETYGDLATTNNGKDDVFVAAYNTSGVQQWLRQIGTNDNDFAHGIALNSTEGVFIAGGTEGVLGDEDPTPGDPVVNFDIFVARYDASGNRVWTRQLGTSGAEWAEAVAASGGKAYLTGMIFTNAIGSDPALGLRDAFLAGIETDSSLLFTRQFGSSEYDMGMAINVGTLSEIYITGFVNSVDITSDGGDVMLYKFNADGSDAWNLQLGEAMKADQGRAMMMDSSGLIYITGFTEGALDGHVNVGSGTADIFIMRFDSSGAKQ